MGCLFVALPCISMLIFEATPASTVAVCLVNPIPKAPKMYTFLHRPFAEPDKLTLAEMTQALPASFQWKKLRDPSRSCLHYQWQLTSLLQNEDCKLQLSLLCLLAIEVDRTILDRVSLWCQGMAMEMSAWKQSSFVFVRMYKAIEGIDKALVQVIGRQHCSLSLREFDKSPWMPLHRQYIVQYTIQHTLEKFMHPCWLEEAPNDL